MECMGVRSVSSAKVQSEGGTSGGQIECLICEAVEV
jgi:hypothetical protein